MNYCQCHHIISVKKTNNKTCNLGALNIHRKSGFQGSQWCSIKSQTINALKYVCIYVIIELNAKVLDSCMNKNLYIYEGKVHVYKKNTQPIRYSISYMVYGI